VKAKLGAMLKGRPELQVFLSSTSLDLREHREAIRQRCEALGYRLLAMEEFGAQDDAASDVSLREIAACHVFVGVYARRYGYVPPGASRSVTEMEYDEAKQLGKARLIFVVRPDFHEHDLLEAYRDDDDPSQARRLKTFVARIGEERVFDRFTTPAQLAERVRYALSKWEGWRPPHAPAPRRTYVGRDDLLAQLQAKIIEHQRIALLGMAGMGKSLTAAHLATTMSESFDGGVLWAALGPDATDAQRLVGETMTNWMHSHHPGRLADPETLQPNAVRGWLGEVPGPLLFVFDDIWHAQPARELMRLIPQNATLLVTSRRPDVARQLGIEQTVELTRLSDVDAMTLLRDRVGDMPSRTALRGINDALQGHPLALEIVAAQILKNGPDFADDLPERLGTDIAAGTKLSVLSVEGESRQANVEAALALTYDIMGQDLRRRFRALGVLAPDALITPLIMGGVWGTSADEPEALDDAADRIGALVSGGVLSRVPGRLEFELHGLLRSYARALLMAEGEVASADDRYRKTIVVVAEDGFAKPPATWTQMDIYLPHVHHVGDHIRRDLDARWATLDAFIQPIPPTFPTLPDETARVIAVQALNFAAATDPYITHRQLGEAGGKWLAAGLAAARLLGEAACTLRLTGAIALWHIRAGHGALAIDYLRTALELVQETEETAEEPRLLERLGHAQTVLGDYASAEAAYTRALELLSQSPDRLGEAVVRIGLGVVHRDRGDFAAALGQYELARAIISAAGNLSLLASTLNHIGGIERVIGHPQAAFEKFQQALMLARDTGNQVEEAVTLGNLAGVYWDAQQFETAIPLYERALEIRHDSGDRAGEAKSMSNLGTAYEKAGRMDDALMLYEQALPMLREVGDRAGEAACLSNIGAHRHLTGRHEEALPFLQRALAINLELGNRYGESKVLNLLGDVSYAMSDSLSAKAYYEEALALARDIGDRPSEAQILQNLGILCYAGNALDASLHFYEEALQLMRDVGNRVGEAVTVGNMASVYYTMGQTRRALETLEHARQLAAATGDLRIAAAFAENLRQIRATLADTESLAPPAPVCNAPAAADVLVRFLQVDDVTRAVMYGKYRQVLLSAETELLLDQLINAAQTRGEMDLVNRCIKVREQLGKLRTGG
jgi:tetratricopeptide (TPR) repeat protein